MKSKELSTEGERRFVLVCEKGDDPVETLTTFAGRYGVGGASFTAVGAFRTVTLGYFDPEIMDYRRNPVDEQVEVVSLVGDIASKDGQPRVHAHVVVARSDATTLGGHLLAGTVWPTLELVITEAPTELRKRSDEETGLALIDPDA